jgi:hypothetical protein
VKKTNTLIKTKVNGSNKVCIPSKLSLNNQWCYTQTSIKLRKPLKKTNKDKIILIIGCSMVFGDYLEDNETISSQLQKHLPNYEVINLGIRAGSTQQQLELILSGHLDLFKNKEVILIYGGYYEHIYRANYGISKCCPAWGKRYIEKNNQLYIQGEFKQALAVELPFYYLSVSTIFRTLAPNYFTTRNYSKQEFANYKYQLKKIVDITRNRSSKFRFISFTYYNINEEFDTFLKDISNDFISTKEQFNINDKNSLFIPNDGHPTPYFNKVLSQSILKKIKL